MIKNFIYLDEDKMYSLSSQLFEGVTEYVLNESTSSDENSEAQRGPVGSGKILGDILRNSEKRTEKKFLNDYSFNIFEEKLMQERRVQVFPPPEPPTLDDDRSFIRVTAKAIFNDLESIKSSLSEFNSVGKALAHVTNFDAISSLKQQLEKSASGDRNDKAKIRAQFNSLTNIGRLAAEQGLQQDQKFLENLVFLLGYGFQDQIEIQMTNGIHIFSANLNRRFLREPVELILRKYSRRTEVDFIMFGIVTQKGADKAELTHDLSEGAGIKMGLMNLVHQLSNVEASFTGRLDNEVMVDPIAIFTEI